LRAIRVPTLTASPLTDPSLFRVVMQGCTTGGGDFLVGVGGASGNFDRPFIDIASFCNVNEDPAAVARLAVKAIRSTRLQLLRQDGHTRPAGGQSGLASGIRLY